MKSYCISCALVGCLAVTVPPWAWAMSPEPVTEDFLSAEARPAGSGPGHERRPARVLTGRVSDRFPNILLYTQDNQPVRFYDDLLREKIVVVNFMYTTCQQICIPTTAHLTYVHKLLGDRMGKDILMLSVSLDPEVDTPEVLKAYASRFGSFPGWYFLTGNFHDIESLRYAMGVYDLDPVIDADKTSHSGLITFGNDRTDRWLALPALMDRQEIVNTILRWTGGQRLQPLRPPPG